MVAQAGVSVGPTAAYGALTSPPGDTLSLEGVWGVHRLRLALVLLLSFLNISRARPTFSFICTLRAPSRKPIGKVTEGEKKHRVRSVIWKTSNKKKKKKPNAIASSSVFKKSLKTVSKKPLPRNTFQNVET